MRPETLKNVRIVEELKIGDSVRRDRRSRGDADIKEGKKPIKGQRISRAFNQDMEN